MEENNKEKKGQSVRVLALVLGILAVFVVFGAQLVNWQLVHGAQYRAQADSTNIYTVKKDASRGEILDANGVSLAVNETGYKVVFNNLYVPKGSLNATILQLVALFESRNEEWIDNFPIVVDENCNFAFKQDDGDGTVDSAISLLKSDYRLQQYATAEECINLMASDQWYDCEGYSNSDKRSILAVRYNMAKTGYNNENKYTFAEGISNEMVAIVSENSQKMPGVSVETYSERKYANGSLATNIVGYIGAIDPDTYEEKKDTGDYQLDSKIGIEGIEAALEDKLVGHRGEQLVEVTPNGTIVSETEKTPATSGNTVYLTIDARYNYTAYEALGGKSGTVAVYNYETGEILCMVSAPSYDPLNVPEDITTNDRYKGAYLNRFLSSTFTPGSVYKTVTLAAALEEIPDLADRTWTCSGSVQMGDETIICSGTHGEQDIASAFANSCNVAFAQIAQELGPGTLEKYTEQAGLTGSYSISGLPTAKGSFDFDNITDGQLGWAGVGQYHDQVNPAALMIYMGAIANGGKAAEPYLILRTESALGLPSLPHFTTRTGTLISADTAAALADLMANNVTQTYGASRFPNMDICAKSGTAEVGEGQTPHAWFAGFLRGEETPYAFVVLVENGGGGSSVAGGVAAKVLDVIVNGY